MFKLTTKQKLTLFFIVVLVTGLISINVFMFYYMEARRLENEKNSFKAKNIIDLKAPTTTTTEKPFCQHNTVWIGDGQCDDILNIKTCNYDGGDCCLSDDKIGQAHDMFSRFSHCESTNFFHQIVCNVCFDFSKKCLFDQ